MKSKGGGRRAKLLVDICMTVFLVFSFLRWEGNPTFHLVVGTVCALFFVTHVLLHRNWLRSMTKVYLERKINQGLIGKYRADMLLILVWSISIVTGVFAIGPQIGLEGLSIFGRVHGVTARLGLGLILVHVFQHRKEVLSYFKRKKKGTKAATGERKI